MNLLRCFSLVVVAALLAAAPASAQDTVVTATHGDWEIRCSSAEAKACGMTQAYKDAEGRVVALAKIVRFANQALPDGTKIPGRFEVIVPLGAVLTDGLSVRIDSSEARVAPYRFCVNTGCRMLEPITEEYVAELKAGVTAKVTFTTIDGKTREAPISLKGFTAAYNNLPTAN